MTITSTFFKNIYDNKITKFKKFNTHLEFVKFLYKNSKIEYEEKKDAYLISPAVYDYDSNEIIYEDGKEIHSITRKNINVKGWGNWAGIDIDQQLDGTSLSFIKKFLKDRIGSEYFYVVYSTASSKESHPKFRVILFFDDFIESEDIRNLWFAINTMIDDTMDKQCKDLSRMYYSPGNYKDAFNFFYVNPGKKFLNHRKLIEQFPAPIESNNTKSLFESMPSDIQQRIIDQKKRSTDKSFSWTSYKNCPFINQKLIDEFKSIAHTDGSGRYAMIYKIMTSTAINAVKNDYPINEMELISLIKELDLDTINRYQNRRLDVEAQNAIKYAYVKG